MKVYVSKESKKEETKSTAYSFLLVSILGFVLLLLFVLGVFPIHVANYMKILLCIVMGTMLVIFFFIGISSLCQLKSLELQAKEEHAKSDEILNWFRSSYGPDDIDGSYDTEESDANLYFKRYEIMSGLLQKQYPDLEETFLDHLTERLYADFFEKNDN